VIRFEALERWIAPLKRRVMLMVSRAIIESVDDSAKMQLIKASLLADEVVDEVERFQNYGFTAVPFGDAEALMLSIGGEREHGVIIAIDDRRYRLSGLAGGEVAIYDDQGQKIVLHRDKILIETEKDLEAAVGGIATVNITGDVNLSADGNVTVSTPKAHIDAAAVELGATATEAVIKGNTFQSLFNAHTHVGNLGYQTAPPTQQLTGSELSTVSKTE